MQPRDAAIDDIVGAVWESMLGIPAESAPALDALNLKEVAEHVFSGVIHITGQWDGAITVQCSARLAAVAAQRMFGIEREQLTTPELQDALGEITNMVGGNIKALFPEPCRLGLPIVIEGGDYRLRLSGGRLLHRRSYRADSETVVITVLEEARAA